jgi:hypothetical protein
VIDEDNNLGWFATDRRQPQDTVCIYVFIPNESNPKYNYEEGDTMAIHRAARLISIEDTQTDLREVRNARQRLTILRYELAEKTQQGSFSFMIDDVTTYHEISDFHNKDAARLFERWTQLRNQYQADAARLEKQRDDYANASRQDKERMSKSLLEFEDKVLQAETQVNRMENDVRSAEINYLNR